MKIEAAAPIRYTVRHADVRLLRLAAIAMERRHVDFQKRTFSHGRVALLKSDGPPPSFHHNNISFPALN